MAHVLLIDDDPLFRTMMRRALEGAGHEVRDAENGDVGMKMFAAEPAHVVVTDILMPEKEGIATIRELRGLGRPVTILAVSGGSDWTGRLDVLGFARRLGADDVLWKPFRAQELVDRVARLLDPQVPPQEQAE